MAYKLLTELVTIKVINYSFSRRVCLSPPETLIVIELLPFVSVCALADRFVID